MSVETWAVSMNPSSGSMDLSEQLTELTGTFYSLDRWFVTKGHSSGAARWEARLRQDMGKGHKAAGP